MRTRIIVLLLVLTGGVIAGCGSSSNSSSSSGSSSTSSTAAPSSSSAAASSSAAPSSGGGSTDSAAAQAAKQGCEAGIKNNPAIDASKRSELSSECQKVADAAATGDKSKFKAAYTSFCSKLAGALPAAAQGPAKSACVQGANAIPG